MARYECDCCGACCQGRLIVLAEQLDLLREPRLLSADDHRSDWSLEQALSDLDDPGRCLLIAGPNSCQFLNCENRCTIYPTRPIDCVAMQAGDEQCQEARRAAGLPRLQSIDDSNGASSVGN